MNFNWNSILTFPVLNVNNNTLCSTQLQWVYGFYLERLSEGMYEFQLE